jgi:hypothetical protein
MAQGRIANWFTPRDCALRDIEAAVYA